MEPQKQHWYDLLLIITWRALIVKANSPLAIMMRLGMCYEQMEQALSESRKSKNPVML